MSLIAWLFSRKKERWRKLPVDKINSDVESTAKGVHLTCRNQLATLCVIGLRLMELQYNSV